MGATEKIEELDRAFDLLLVLLGIITATLFQFQGTRLPLAIASTNPNLDQMGLFTEVNAQMTLWLRVLFIPLILLIGIWRVNRIALRARIRARKNVSEFSYAMCITILGADIVYFMGAATYRPEQFAVVIGGTPFTPIMVLFNFLVSLGLIYSYEMSFTGAESRPRGIWKSILARAIAMWFIALS